MVSLLVIPKLPFPYRNELKERQRQQYASLQDFIASVVLPEMQIKLRQGFGRAIRMETDTCVIAVLDDRAAAGQRYFVSLSFLNVTFRSSGFSSDKMASSILASNFPESEKARILRAWAKDEAICA